MKSKQILIIELIYKSFYISIKNLIQTEISQAKKFIKIRIYKSLALYIYIKTSFESLLKKVTLNTFIKNQY